MKERVAGVEFVNIASAANLTDVMNLRMMLDRTGIPYRMRNEGTNSIYPDTLFGAVDFDVPAARYKEALAVMNEIFEIRLDNIPEVCPACEAKTISNSADCPDCGLFLG